MTTSPPKKKKSRFSQFPAAFWLVIMFEFFERGSYYGMMSVLSVYFTDVLFFSKESVGVIKGVIQPILYFLPIIAGALADRFGYRRALTLAFALLGLGYFLTSQTTTYTAVFGSLTVMAVGAGIFKPVISGTIARTTNPENSTIGFGIYYWSINLGAFLFPLVLVPYLKTNLGWHWVVIASSICTAAMLVPTLLFFWDPASRKQTSEERKEETKDRAGLFMTIANAFEIIYSPFVLLFLMLRRRAFKGVAVAGLFLIVLAVGIVQYSTPRAVEIPVARVLLRNNDRALLLEIERNQSSRLPFKIVPLGKESKRLLIKVHRPRHVASFAKNAAAALAARADPSAPPTEDEIQQACRRAEKRPTITFRAKHGEKPGWFRIRQDSPLRFTVTFSPERDKELHRRVSEGLRELPVLAGVTTSSVALALRQALHRRFFLLFVGLLFATSLLILWLKERLARTSKLAMACTGAAMLLLIWLLPGLDTFTRVLCSFIFPTLLALFPMETGDREKFQDHFRFLAMVFIYSGFWVLYFQMFDSVLWYVKAYVDASPLDSAVNRALACLHIGYRFRFDVEHVTVINAGTIIALQLLISSMVKRTRALPTMVVGIFFGTVGMAILALSTSIWIFLAGIAIFSIGEMTAHPKFISYIGQTAPKARAAMYMGYVFLYGVIGSSIGGVLGARLYVEFVDNKNQPRLLWLIFSAIGVATIIGLLVYDRCCGTRDTADDRKKRESS